MNITHKYAGIHSKEQAIDLFARHVSSGKVKFFKSAGIDFVLGGLFGVDFLRLTYLHRQPYRLGNFLNHNRCFECFFSGWANCEHAMIFQQHRRRSANGRYDSFSDLLPIYQGESAHRNGAAKVVTNGSQVDRNGCVHGGIRGGVRRMSMDHSRCNWYNSSCNESSIDYPII